MSPPATGVVVPRVAPSAVTVTEDGLELDPGIARTPVAKRVAKTATSKATTIPMPIEVYRHVLDSFSGCLRRIISFCSYSTGS